MRILSTIDRELLKPSASVALHKHSNALVDILPPESDSSITMLGADEKPDISYVDIGGLDLQKQEMREAVELPLTHFELYKQIGIDPPRGVLMYGPPGCGKTMLAKAVAHHTTGKRLVLRFNFKVLSNCLICEQPRLFAWLVLSLCKSIWARDLAWFVMCFDSPRKTRRQSFLSMRSMRSPQNVSMLKREVCQKLMQK